MTQQTWRTRFVDAFNEVLSRDPDTAPGPTAINEAIYGKQRFHKYNQLNGRQAALRRELLENAGFVKDSASGRWVRQ